MGLFGNKRPNDKVDYAKLNELIGFSRNFMKLIFSVSIVALVVLLTYIFKEWKLLNILGDILSILLVLFWLGYLIRLFAFFKVRVLKERLV